MEFKAKCGQRKWERDIYQCNIPGRQEAYPHHCPEVLLACLSWFKTTTTWSGARTTEALVSVMCWAQVRASVPWVAAYTYQERPHLRTAPTQDLVSSMSTWERMRNAEVLHHPGGKPFEWRLRGREPCILGWSRLEQSLMLGTGKVERSGFGSNIVDSWISYKFL